MTRWSDESPQAYTNRMIEEHARDVKNSLEALLRFTLPVPETSEDYYRKAYLRECQTSAGLRARLREAESALAQHRKVSTR